MTIRPNVTELNPLGALLAASGRGDRRAFQQVYQLSSAKLFGIALRMLRQREAAEEVLQESFVAIWRRASQYQPERGQPMTWMASIVRNRAIDRMRAEKRTPNAAATLEDIPEARLAYDLSGLGDEGLAGCLEQLKADQRGAIILAYYHGLTHEELAAHVDAPLGTVKSWVRRGLIRLKDCLDQ